MPEMELGNLNEIDFEFRLDAYEMWPNDEELRRLYIRRKVAGCIISICDEQVAKGFADDRRRLLEILQSIGGYSDEDSYGKTMMPWLEPVRRKQMVTVGNLVIHLAAMESQRRSLRGGPSIRKACSLLSNGIHYGLGDVYTSRKEIEKALGKYRRSCHLIAGHLTMIRLFEEWDEDDEDDYIMGRLALAKYFERYMMELLPLHGTKRPVLTEEDQIWLIPKGLKIPELDASPWAVAANAIETLKRYKAPA